jgi:endonuclease/exonuclease/phosphatase family metal-dependent hydrolase
MRTLFVITSALLISATCLLSCRAVKCYEKPDDQFLYYNKKDTLVAEQTPSLNVVTFNIKKARKIQLAIAELKQLEKTRPVDVYMLQEMDEKGVEEIAKQMNLNYLYIPIVYDHVEKKNIGNAILSRGAIEHPEKLMLPHARWTNKQRRSVTIGEVTVRQKKILVYSVHTETLVMSRKNRMDQIDGIIQHAKTQSSNYKYILIGGDFNTLLSRDADMVVDKFKGGGFDWSTASVGSTARAMFGLVKPRHDYLFSRGLTLGNASRIETSVSSDHYPVFSTLMF